MATAFIAISGVLFLLLIAIYGLAHFSLGEGPASMDPSTKELVNLIPTVSLLAILADVVAWIAFFYWIHATTKRVSALSTQKPSFSPGWAVGYFLVPVVSLYRAPAVVAELWRASDPAHSREGNWSNNAGSPKILLWWALTLSAPLVLKGAESLVSSEASGGRVMAGDMQSVVAVLITGYLIWAVALFLRATILREIDRRLALRATAVGVSSS